MYEFTMEDLQRFLFEKAEHRRPESCTVLNWKLSEISPSANAQPGKSNLSEAKEICKYNSTFVKVV